MVCPDFSHVQYNKFNDGLMEVKNYLSRNVMITLKGGKQIRGYFKKYDEDFVYLIGFKQVEHLIPISSISFIQVLTKQTKNNFRYSV